MKESKLVVGHLMNDQLFVKSVTPSKFIRLAQMVRCRGTCGVFCRIVQVANTDLGR